MRIVILNQFFYPDHSATSQLMTELAESLVERGHQVTALAGRGRYNGGESLSSKEEYRGIQIRRAWGTGFGKGSGLGRLSDYLSFYLGASWSLLSLPRHDIVMPLTTPPMIGLVALIIGRLRGMKVVSLVQDVYPDVAVALGALRARNPLTRFLNYLSRLVLRNSERIVVLGDCMRERVAARIGEDAGARIDVIHNWADGTKIHPLQDEKNDFSARHNLEDKFVVLFSGNLGRVNDFSTVLESARLLRDRPDILFLFIGEGAQTTEINRFIEQHDLSNVRLLPYQPQELLRYSLAAGHVSLVTLREGLAGLSMPSKTYGILAAGRPVLFIGDQQSEVARIIADNHCGAVVSSGDSQAAAQLIADWSSNRSKLAELNFAARTVFEKRFERQQAVNAYLETFTKCLELPRTVKAGDSNLKEVSQ